RKRAHVRRTKTHLNEASPIALQTLRSAGRQANGAVTHRPRRARGERRGTSATPPAPPGSRLSPCPPGAGAARGSRLRCEAARAVRESARAQAQAQVQAQAAEAVPRVARPAPPLAARAPRRARRVPARGP